MCRPKAEHQAATQLVLELVEDARQFEHAGVSRRIVGRRLSGPGILVTADQDEIAGLGSILDLDLADRNLHRPPAILHVRPEPDAHGTLRAHVLQLETGGTCDTNARQCWHLVLVVLRGRISPYRLY